MHIIKTNKQASYYEPFFVLDIMDTMRKDLVSLYWEGETLKKNKTKKKPKVVMASWHQVKFEFLMYNK